MLYRDGEKYLESTDGVGQPLGRELYDLNVDPEEKNDLSTKAKSTALDRAAAELSRLRESAGEKSLTKDEIEIDYKQGLIKNITSGTNISFDPLPDFALEIIDDGGLLEHIKKGTTD